METSPGNDHLTVLALRAAAGLLTVAGAAVVLCGLLLVADDMATRGEMFDGLGAVLGLALCAPGVLLLVVAAVVLRFQRRRPFPVAVALCVLGLLLASAGVTLTGALGLPVAVPMLVGGLVLAGLGLAAALGTAAVTVDSPGGISR